MITETELRTILQQISYRHWAIVPGRKGDMLCLQVQFDAPDPNNPGEMNTQYGRKWIISPHMTKSEVVQTALKAILTAEEHEAREQFRYQGKPVFSPHFDVDRLKDLVTSAVFDARSSHPGLLRVDNGRKFQAPDETATSTRRIQAQDTDNHNREVLHG